MDLESFKNLEDEAVKARFRVFDRSRLDETLQWFGGQYALICQRLEAVYNREARFAKVRPGGLAEIDEAIHLAGQDHEKEVSLLKAFRELNRVLLPFMDVYEEAVLGDLKHMSQQELEHLNTSVSEELSRASQTETQNPADYRSAQNAAGTLRLATLMKEAIGKELKTRFGAEPQ